MFVYNFCFVAEQTENQPEFSSFHETPIYGSTPTIKPATYASTGLYSTTDLPKASSTLSTATSTSHYENMQMAGNPRESNTTSQYGELTLKWTKTTYVNNAVAHFIGKRPLPIYSNLSSSLLSTGFGFADFDCFFFFRIGFSAVPCSICSICWSFSSLASSCSTTSSVNIPTTVSSAKKSTKQQQQQRFRFQPCALLDR